MPKSYNGKILHVDLSDGRWWVEELDEKIYRRYLGGGALATYFMLRDMKPGIDPLGPENLLIFMTSVINGLPLSGANRYTAAGKSPLSGGFGEAEAGGYWGPEFKRTGFDGAIIHGRAEKPVYLYVHDSQCEIRDASHYWGKLADEVQEGLEEELGDSRITVLQTGIAGENGVLYAAIVNQLRHFHGRAGLGAVMGSKNLKAIVARGKERIAAEEREKANGVLQWFRDNYDKENDRMHLYGTAGGVVGLDLDGILPTNNFRNGSFEHAKEISGQRMAETILVNRGTCYACTVACKREVEVESRGVSPKFGGMEYEIIGALGSTCGVGDMEAIAEASQWVNRYVIDGISAGVSIAWAMECYEKGILSQEDTDGIELTWGNADAMLAMIHKIARREGFGDILADGVKRAAERVGRGSEQFAIHVKGQELPMHEPRGKVALSLAYAVSPTGADHMEAIHDPSFEGLGVLDNGLSEVGLLEPLDRMYFGPEKVRAFFYAQAIWSLYNSVGMCDFVGIPIGALKLTALRDYVAAATGWDDMTMWELVKVGERANTMSRLFNLREGFGIEDDQLPQRMFDPLENGKLKGVALDREAFDRALRLYYQMAGWTAEGVPTEAKLAELDLVGVDGPREYAMA
ncbi:MAG: aldehyde ferredoxin oxidoreductase family protein [Caldilineaceae bacterium]|nr:aldehyde ferredoxin oxidoreductase family protein [Caldilineaceae bacterium]